MGNLSLAMRARGDEGEALPTVFTQLEALGARVRRGQVTLIAGAPGRGKSAIATHLAVNLEYSDMGDGVPSLYFSADSDRMTLGTRVAAGILHKNLQDVEELLTRQDHETWQLIADVTQHIWWNFDSALTLQDINDEIEAYALVWGEYPHLIVVDNLNNVSDGAGESKDTQDRVMDYLAQVARHTSAAVVVLHHVTGAYEDGQTPVPLSGLMNKVGKRPRLIITLYQHDSNILGACIVKNTTGRADPAAQDVVAHIGWLPSRSFLADGRS